MRVLFIHNKYLQAGGEDAVVRAGGIPPIPETQDYVAKVTHFYRRYRTIPEPLEASIGSD